MKKILTTILILLFTCCAFAEEATINGKPISECTPNELYDIRNQINAILDGLPTGTVTDWEHFRAEGGYWTAGVDFPVGRYEIFAVDMPSVIIVYRDKTEMSYNHTTYKNGFVFTFEEGDIAMFYQPMYFNKIFEDPLDK